MNMKREIVGRKSICWKCGDEFILGPMGLQEDKPRCNDCRGDAELVHVVDDPFSSFVNGLKKAGE